MHKCLLPACPIYTLLVLKLLVLILLIIFSALCTCYQYLKLKILLLTLNKVVILFSVLQIKEPEDFRLWHETMVTEFPEQMQRLLAGPMWSGLDPQDMRDPLKVNWV